MAHPQSIMRVEDLVSAASLGVSVLAGEAGTTREVLWAHSCEMESPEKWLAPHELLMTVGLCVPADPDEQIEFVARLDEAQLAGLMIGDHDTTPSISDGMLAEADRRGFPVLWAATETPYAVVARHVAAASSSSQILQVLKLSKLYQVAASSDDDAAALVRSLSNLLRVGIRIVDRATGTVFLEADHVLNTLPGPDTESTERTERTERTYVLRGRTQADLVVLEHEGEPLDSFLLVHLIKVLEVAVDQALGAIDRQEEQSARELTRLLAGTLTPDSESLLAGIPIAEGYRVAAFPSPDARRIARRIALRRDPVLVGPGRTCHLALIPESLVDTARALAAESDSRFGVSSVFTDYRDVRTAAEEAARVLSAAQHSHQPWVEFEGSTIAVLSRSQREAEEIVSGVLGSLADPTASARKLRETLFAYLRHDRHWQSAADELGIHRQTLFYRLNRIEEETGLSVTKSADLSAFWIAYQAWRMTHD